MTAAQRATLEIIRASASEYEPETIVVAYGYEQAGDVADALRAALGTCGTCRWLGADDSYQGHGFCSAPAHTDIRRERYPFVHKLMPLGERCTGWTAKEDA